MIIVCEDKLFKAINKTNIYEMAESFHMSVSIFKTTGLKYDTLYVFVTDDDEKELLKEIDEFEDIEQIIYKDYPEKYLENYQGHWYDEINITRISKKTEKRLISDSSVRREEIQLFESILNNNMDDLVKHIMDK